MGENILLLPNPIKSATLIPHESALHDFGGEAFLLVMSTSVIIVGIDGKVHCTINLPNESNKSFSKQGGIVEIVAATYMNALCSVLLALSDASLVHVPLLTFINNKSDAEFSGIVDAGSFERFIWPSQPISVTSLQSSTDGCQHCLVRCEIGALAILKLASYMTTDKDNANFLPQCPDSSPSKLPNLLLVHSAGPVGNVFALLEHKSKTDNEIQVLSWCGVKGWLTLENIAVAPSIAKLQNGEQPHSLCSSESGAVFVVLRKPSVEKTASRWIKISVGISGRELFSRECGDIEPLQCAFLRSEGDEGTLIVLGSDSCLRGWCGRFGTITSQWKVDANYKLQNDRDQYAAGSDSHGAKSSKRTATKSTVDNLLASRTNSFASQHFCFVGTASTLSLYCARVNQNGSALSRLEINGNFVARSGLVRAVGSQRKDQDGIATVIYNLHLPLQKDVLSESSTPGSVGKGVLNVLARPLKRKLQQASAWRVKCTETSNEPSKDLNEEDDDASRKRTKNSSQHDQSSDILSKNGDRKAPPIPLEASTAFLRALKGRNSSDILTSDWDVLLTLLTAYRCVGLQYPNNSDLIEQAFQAGRLDALCYIVRYAPDLTERQAMQLLTRLATWDAHSTVGQQTLSNLSIAPSGMLTWTPPNDVAKDVVDSTKSTKSSKSKKKTSSNGLKESEHCVTHIDILRSISESLLRRNGAFSVTLLVDAARAHVPSSVAALLLNIFLLPLRGFCPAKRNNHTNPLKFQGYVHDLQVRRAATWCDAILDAHFCDIALTIGAGHRASALQSALKVAGDLLPVEGIAAGAVIAEDVLGMWTHVFRSARATKERGGRASGASLSPPEGLYRLERVIF